ncbi:MAG TPA: hypothetical protein VG755_12515, partial [Nannocystaceae bacterium]|nr:hypothetical protein [Nannocystaceae bacterium]
MREVVGYLVIALVVLAPPFGSLDRAIVAGSEPCDTVPFALSWAIGWGQSRIDVLGAGWWDAPIFHPTPGAFALSEPMPLLSLVAWPLHAIGVPLATCVTTLVLACMVANAAMMRRLLLRLRVGPALATVGGAIALLLPFVHQELGVLPLVAVWPLVWMMTALLDLFDGRRSLRRAAIELGLAIGLGFACCGQLTLFGVLALLPASLCLVQRRHLRPSFAGALALATAIGSAIVLPLALPQRATLAALDLHRSDRSQSRGAIKPMQLVRVPWPGLVPLPRSWVARDVEARALDPGPLRVLAAISGAALGLQRRRRRREIAMLLAVVLAALALASGPRLGPLADALELVPGYGQIRALFRATALAQIGVIALAMIGLRMLQVRLRRRRGLVVLFAALLLVELVPPSPRWTTLPDPELAWVQWLRDEAEPGAAIAWIPFAPSGDVCDHEGTARAMLLGLAHGHPLVNGYSS